MFLRLEDVWWLIMCRDLHSALPHCIHKTEMFPLFRPLRSLQLYNLKVFSDPETPQRTLCVRKSAR